MKTIKFIILLSIVTSCISCTDTSCYFDTHSCKIVLTNKNYKIIGFKIGSNRKDYMWYKILAGKTGDSVIDLSNPDSINYNALIKNRLVKDSSYYMNIAIGEKKEDGSIEFKGQFILSIENEDWKSANTVKGYLLRM